MPRDITVTVYAIDELSPKALNRVRAIAEELERSERGVLDQVRLLVPRQVHSYQLRLITSR